MSELISKRRLEEALICGLCRNEKTDDYKNGLWDALRVAEAIEPVNAVELPCKIGDTVYELCKFCNTIHEYEVVGFRYKYEMVFIECDKRELTNKAIGVTAFFNREQAEKALEDLKNDK